MLTERAKWFVEMFFAGRSRKNQAHPSDQKADDLMGPRP